MRCIIGAALLLVAAPAAASLQADFDKAQAAFDGERWQEARDLFAALLTRLPSTQSHTAALISAWIGVAAARLNDPEAAIVRLETAVKQLDRPGDTLDRLGARLELAAAYEAVSNTAAAAREYSAIVGDSASSKNYNLAARLGRVRSLTFTNPASARAEYDALAPEAIKVFAGKPNELAGLYSLRGRIELNDRQYSAARSWFLKALPLTGGLSRKVTIRGQQVRGDLALVSHFSGNEDDARRYLAFTGTGRLPAGGFGFNASIPPPACAPLTNLKPDDVAVIEINIGADGRVNNASTIYASRSGGPDTEFAATARKWWWTPEAVTRLPPFWRQAVRLEVRCSSTRPTTALGLDLFMRDIEAWYATAKIEPLPQRLNDDRTANAMLVAELARREAKYGATSPQLFPLLLVSPVDQAEDRVAFNRLLAVARAGGAPRDVLMALESGTAFRVLPVDKKLRQTEVSAAAVPILMRVISDAVARGANDTRGIAFVRAILGIEREKLRDYTGATAAFRDVVATSPLVLPEADPIRQLALLRLASLAAARRDLDEAKSLYQRLA